MAATSTISEVWPQEKPAIDPSRVDRAQAALRTKLETMNGVTHANGFDQAPEDTFRRLFATADTDRSGKLSEKEFVQLLVKKFNFAGYEEDARALFRRFDTERDGLLEIREFGAGILGRGPLMSRSTIGKVREVLARRAGGASSLKSLGLQFKLLDETGSGSVDREELQIGFDKFLRGFGITLGKVELDQLFDLFDYNKDGSISYDEFLFGVRGRMGDSRRALVKQAFELLDDDKSGVLTLDEIAGKYDVSQQPLVKAGKLTKDEAMKIFMRNWDKDGDSQVTLDEFYEYYEWVSASIDNDDYFELMMRNAWHISGGEGASQNTTCLRVLVTHMDGRQTVEEVKNDLGVRKHDIATIKNKLKWQGINAKEVSLTS